MATIYSPDQKTDLGCYSIAALFEHNIGAELTNITEDRTHYLEILLTDCRDDQIRNLLPIVEAALAVVKGRSLNNTE